LPTPEVTREINTLCPRGAEGPSGKGIVIMDTNGALLPRSFGTERLGGDTLWHFSNTPRQVQVQQLLYAVECAGW
jgi:hypothetical protein